MRLPLVQVARDDAMLMALGVVGIVAAWAMFAFNRLVRLRNQARTAWSDIDVQLQRRHDLVPQLVAAVQGYAAHERATLEAVTELRAQAVAAHGPARQGEAETALEQALSRLLALREAYPDLRASENFTQLSAALVQVEEHLQYARRFYNGAVRDFSDATQRMPDVLVARGFGFVPPAFFQAEAGSDAAPRIGLVP